MRGSTVPPKTVWLNLLLWLVLVALGVMAWNYLSAM
jgi:hypothetical protein